MSISTPSDSHPAAASLPPRVPRPGAGGAVPLRAALERGALVTAANWPVVLIDFALESFYKLALTVPAIGGALMVTALIGTDMGAVVGEGIRSTMDLVLGSLSTAPVALFTFLTAMGLVAFGGAVIVFALKAGTFSVLVAAERRLGDEEDLRFDRDRLLEASAYRLESVYRDTRRFGGRMVVLTVWLSGAYLVIGLGSLAAMSLAVSLAAAQWDAVWPLVIVGATSLAVIALAAVNLTYDLLRVIVLTDDCRTRVAAARLRQFVTRDARQVLGLFSVISGVTILATAVSVLATAGLTLIAWVPLLSLAIVPIQAAAWIVRGLIFQAMALTALSAYQTQYRRFSAARPG
jgi:hypothetical protein